MTIESLARYIKGVPEGRYVSIDNGRRGRNRRVVQVSGSPGGSLRFVKFGSGKPWLRRADRSLALEVATYLERGR